MTHPEHSAFYRVHFVDCFSTSWKSLCGKSLRCKIITLSFLSLNTMLILHYVGPMKLALFVIKLRYFYQPAKRITLKYSHIPLNSSNPWGKSSTGDFALEGYSLRINRCLIFKIMKRKVWKKNYQAFNKSNINS